VEDRKTGGRVVFTFEKKRGSGSAANGNVRIYIYHQKDRPAVVQIIIRIPGLDIAKAGWFFGDYAIPSVDIEKRQWVLSRTTDRGKGYKLSSTSKGHADGSSAYVKLTLSPEKAAEIVPDGECDGEIISGDSRSIVISY
jgi:hypothetical protein